MRTARRIEAFENRDIYYQRMAAAYGASIGALFLCFITLSLYEPKPNTIIFVDEEIQLLDVKPTEIVLPELTEQSEALQHGGSIHNTVTPEEWTAPSDALTLPVNEEGTTAETVPMENGNTVTEKPETEKKRSFHPKQLREVLPASIDESVSGTIKLQLRIGVNGTPVSYVVLVNTVWNDEVFRKVIDAAFSSSWQTLIVDGEAQEYVTEKSYTFGNPDY